MAFSISFSVFIITCIFFFHSIFFINLCPEAIFISIKEFSVIFIYIFIFQFSSSFYFSIFIFTIICYTIFLIFENTHTIFQIFDIIPIICRTIIISIYSFSLSNSHNKISIVYISICIGINPLSMFFI